jgi:hypothetical protein
MAKKRFVSIRQLDDGMSSLSASLTATDAEACWQMLTRLAKSLRPEDARTLDARRSDLLVDLLTGRVSVTDGDPGAGRPVIAHATAGKPLIQIVVGLDTLTGNNNLPAELVGYGPIPADIARDAAADGVWKRLVTDPVGGALLDHGRQTYRPPASLNDFLRARDQTCRNPICTHRALDADLDHHRRWEHHGDTDEENLFGHCRHRHVLKENEAWQVIANPVGTLALGTRHHPSTSNPTTTGRRSDDRRYRLTRGAPDDRPTADPRSCDQSVIDTSASIDFGAVKLEESC